MIDFGFRAKTLFIYDGVNLSEYLKGICIKFDKATYMKVFNIDCCFSLKQLLLVLSVVIFVFLMHSFGKYPQKSQCV